MKIYDTMSRSVRQFEPLEEGRVKLYTCGPTVYDYPHIGNLRSFVFDDTLRRALQAKGYEVKHVMNVTDVGHLVSDEDEGEDKLEKGAGRENKTVQEVARMYTDAFLTDVKQLNILEPNAYQGPRGPYAFATDFIKQQIDIVQLLLDKGFAYRTESAIYFDVTKLTDYGKLSGQKLSEKEVAARAEVVTDDAKHHPQDFALWFFTIGRFADHSLRWPSPWGQGFPGWHLECSAIIHDTLGEPIDIHTGGVDHIGTHHTNEIAQTEAAYGAKLANYWMHNEYLLVNGQKMSKSLHNYYTLRDLTEKGYEPLSLRLMFLQSHYRTQTNFTEDGLSAAAAALDNLQAWADLRFQLPSQTTVEQLEAIKNAIFNDLNTPQALALIAELGPPDKDFLKSLDDLLGLELSDREDISDESKSLIAEREKARASKDWRRGDELRQELLGHGIGIEDTPDGPLWRRIKD